MDTKTAAIAINRKSLISEGERRGEFEGYASVYGIEDLAGDVVQPGAFARSIAQTGGKVKLLYQHDPRRPIGIGRVVEDGRGLFLAGKLSLGTTDGHEAYQFMRDGVLDALSIGYQTIRADRPKGGARKLHELRLVEVSVVSFPANTSALISSVKGNAEPATQHFRQLLGDLTAMTDRLDGERRERAERLARATAAALYRKLGRIARRLNEATR